MVSKSQTITDCSDIAHFPELNVFVIRNIKPFGSKPVEHRFTGYLASSLSGARKHFSIVGVCETISSWPAAPLLLLILSKQFTKRWPDVARSGDERPPHASM
jgi:hypothetical protein